MTAGMVRRLPQMVKSAGFVVEKFESYAMRKLPRRLHADPGRSGADILTNWKRSTRRWPTG